MFNIGDKVEFRAKVFFPPYTPYYNAYDMQVFQIIKFHIHRPYEDDLVPSNQYEPGCHVELKCTSDPEIKVAGYVHDDEICHL